MKARKVAKLTSVAVAFPFVYGYMRLLRHVPLKNMRFRGGSIQTPVVHYEHVVTGRKIVFVGMMHVGEKEYYEKVQRVISSHHGYKVLYEKIGKLTDEEKESLNEKELVILEKITGIGYFMEKLCDTLDLVLLKENLEYNEEWVNTDITMFELVKLFAEEDIDFGITEKEVDKLLEDREKIRWVLNIAFRNFIPLFTIGKFVALFRRKIKKEMKIILYYRNMIALENIEMYDRDSDIVSVWGSAHFPQIDKDLRKMGYKEVSKDWISAYHDRKYKSARLVEIEVTKVKA